jgi:hypothetical protein
MGWLCRRNGGFQNNRLPTAQAHISLTLNTVMHSAMRTLRPCFLVRSGTSLSTGRPARKTRGQGSGGLRVGVLVQPDTHTHTRARPLHKQGSTAARQGRQRGRRPRIHTSGQVLAHSQSTPHIHHRQAACSALRAQRGALVRLGGGGGGRGRRALRDCPS